MSSNLLVTGTKDALGIQAPELPVDLGAATEAITGGGQELAASAAGVMDGAAAAGQTLAGDVAGATEAVTGSVTNIVPDLNGK